MPGLWKAVFTFTYPSTAGVVGAPQMTSQPVSSIFLCSLLPSGTWQTLGLSSPQCCLSTSFSNGLVFFPPGKMVLDRPDEQETCPYHFSFHLFMIRRSSSGPIACWILAQTSSLITWSLYEMHSNLQLHLISMACILLWISAVRIHGSQAYRKMDMTRERISRILVMQVILGQKTVAKMSDTTSKTNKKIK